jgi:hypothetical protein
MGGKGRALSANISNEVRMALEKEAAEHGRSMSHVAERWLDEARKGQASYHALLGGTQLAAGVEKLIALTRDVESRTTPDVRHEALVAAWTKALPWVIPRSTVGDFAIILQTRWQSLCDACDALTSAIDKAPANDPVRLRLDLPVNPKLGGPTIRTVILRVYGGEWQIAPELDLLKAAGSTAAAEISAVNLAITSIEIAIEENEKRLSEARNLGRAIAAAHGFNQSVAVQGRDPA